MCLEATRGEIIVRGTLVEILPQTTMGILSIHAALDLP